MSCSAAGRKFERLVKANEATRRLGRKSNVYFQDAQTLSCVFAKSQRHEKSHIDCIEFLDPVFPTKSIQINLVNLCSLAWLRASPNSRPHRAR